MRIILEGAPQNRDAIGASIRLVAENGQAPRRLKSSSSALVIAAPKSTAAIDVIWPDGAKTTTPINPGQAELILRHPSLN
jgi:hypothetical protein